MDRGLRVSLAGLLPELRAFARFLAGLEAAGPRGTSVEAFAERLRGTAAAGGAQHATVEQALAAALAEAQAEDRILVFGSFHTVAAAITALGSEAG